MYNYYALKNSILDKYGMKSDTPKAVLMVTVGTLNINPEKTLVVDHIVKNRLKDVKEVEILNFRCSIEECCWPGRSI